MALLSFGSGPLNNHIVSEPPVIDPRAVDEAEDKSALQRADAETFQISAGNLGHTFLN